jgi:hypothetical protein
MDTAAVKQEIHAIIDMLPDYKLLALHPLLYAYNYEDDTVLTEEERLEVMQCLEDYRKDPSSFTPIEELYP